MEPNGCLFGFLANLFGGARRSSTGAGFPRVIVNERFVTPAEADFYRVLRAVVGARGHVLAQVSLGQLLWFPPGQAGAAGWRNKWRGGRSTSSGATSRGGEVRGGRWRRSNWTSPRTPGLNGRRWGQARDEDVRAILDAAGLPLLGVLASRRYDTRELEAAVGPYLPAAPRR